MMDGDHLRLLHFLEKNWFVTFIDDNMSKLGIFTKRKMRSERKFSKIFTPWCKHTSTQILGFLE